MFCHSIAPRLVFKPHEPVEMVAIVLVIGLNIVITLTCFLLAWKLWHVSRALEQVTILLNEGQHRANLLRSRDIPSMILQQQRHTAFWRQQYYSFWLQMHRLQQLRMVLRLLSGFRWGK